MKNAYRLSLIAVAVVLVLAGCRRNDKNNNNNNTSTDNTIYQAQDPSHANALGEGAPVLFEDVVVTAIDRFGSRTGNVWVQEPSGGAFSGVMLFEPSVVGGTVDDVAVGDLVDITSGTIHEFALTSDTSGRAVTEIEGATIVVRGPTDPAVAQTLFPQQAMSDPSAEEWEGVLVTFENVRVTDVDTNFGQVTFTGGLIASDDLFSVTGSVQRDECYARITGVMSYFFTYFVLPRGGADIQLAANNGDCDQAATEICDNQVDDDGDSYVDCDDFDCSDAPNCFESDCNDSIDNDGDGDTDCADADCAGTVACPLPTENTNALCTDNIDNDGDGLTDCADPSCHNHPDVSACKETNCNDNVDNDLDGRTDCEDRDCLAAGLCDSNPNVEAGVAECTDATDNDGNTYTDCADNSCRYSVAACREDTVAACTDGIDNDLNGYTDCLDFSCQYLGICNAETGDATCSDGQDNDSDGFADCRDWSCQRNPAVTVCEGNAVTCADGLDNDGNGFTDCEDFACRYCDPNGTNSRVVSTCERCP